MKLCGALAIALGLILCFQNCAQRSEPSSPSAEESSETPFAANKIASDEASRIYAPISLPEVPIGSVLPEQEQGLFHWAPNYPINIPAFNNANQAFFRLYGPNGAEPQGDSGHGFKFFNGTELEQRHYLNAVLPLFPAGAKINATKQSAYGVDARPVFDINDTMYTSIYVRAILKNGTMQWKRALLDSFDYGRTWRASDMGDDIFTVNMEHTSTADAIAGPPAFLISFRSPDSDKYVNQGPNGEKPIFPFGNFGRLYLQLYSRGADGKLAKSDRLLLTERGIAAKPHGNASQIVRFGTKIFVTWQEMNLEPGATSTPLMVGEYDTVTKVFRRDKLLDVKPINDDHAQPNLLIDSKGILHLISGSHSATFYHRYSLAPARVIGEWSKPVAVDGGGTYMAAAIDKQDRIHIAYRKMHAADPSRFQGRDWYLTLAYRRFADGRWSEPRTLVEPTQAGYANYYQEMSLDRLGNVYVFYSHWHETMPYGIIPGTDPQKINCAALRFPALLKSEDGGDSFFLANDEDLIKPAKWQPLKIASGYMGDGALDGLVVVTKSATPNMMLYKQDPQSKAIVLDRALRLPYDLSSRDVAVLTGDIDGDGIDEVGFPFVTKNDGTISLRTHAFGKNGSTAIKRYDIEWPSATEDVFFLNDVNGDGKAELVGIGRGDDSLRITTATFRDEHSSVETVTVNLSSPVAASSRRIEPVMGDFNGDKKADIALVLESPGKRHVHLLLSTGLNKWSLKSQTFAVDSPRIIHSLQALDADTKGRDQLALISRDDANKLHVTYMAFDGKTIISKDREYPEGSSATTLGAVTGKFLVTSPREFVALPLWAGDNFRVLFKGPDNL